MSAHEALSHPWITLPKDEPESAGANGHDLLPVIKKNFNARRTLHAAIDTIRAINKLREGGAAGMMDGALSKDPRREEYKVKEENLPSDTNFNGDGGGPDAMEIDSRGMRGGRRRSRSGYRRRRCRNLLWGCGNGDGAGGDDDDGGAINYLGETLGVMFTVWQQRARIFIIMIILFFFFLANLILWLCW